MKVCILMLSLFAAACSGIKVIEKGIQSDLYREDFLTQIDQIKTQYKQGKKNEALKSLRQINGEQLLPVEKSLKHNLIGVILFSQDDFEKAIFNFDIALTTSGLDEGLTSQVYLNVASSYFKLEMTERAFTSLSLIQPDRLKDDEKKRYYHMTYILANQLGKDRVSLKALARLLGFKKTFESVSQSPLFDKLQGSFNKMSRSEKIRFIEEFEGEELISIAFLAHQEAEKLYYSGEKDAAEDLIAWIKDNYKNVEIRGAVEGFKMKTSHLTKLNTRSIGVVLPFSGKGKNDALYARRAMMGIDFAFQKYFKDKPSSEVPIIHFKDSMGSPVVGANAVIELVEKKQVSIIIGGLLPGEAEREYLEAKKRGVVFISLYPIYLPRSQKNSLLVEIPGSVESQLESLLAPEVLKDLGNRVALFYPENKSGNAFMNEFWNLRESKNIEITKVQSYEKNLADYTSQVKNLLRLKHQRERKEEYELYSKLHSLQRKRGIRRNQTLPPDVDFDWVFLPSSPREAMQIIPSFKFYDAFNLKFVGGPNWRSRELVNESSRYGKVYFVGDNVNEISDSFVADFEKSYKKKPRLIEILSYDAMLVGVDILKDIDTDDRGAFESHVNGLRTIRGLVGTWNNKNNLWIKEMTLLRMRKNKIEEALTAAEETSPQSEDGSTLKTVNN